MNASMEWSKLLLEQRYTSEVSRAAPIVHPTSGVSVFLEDAERVLYSSPFRRLQGKTQVHPLPNFDYLRTRLTHTIEVAHVGRIIATECAQHLKDLISNAGDIVYAACLAHDMGNPPFGHVGEYAIQTWFERNKMNALADTLKMPTYKNDFLHFDGNAQGFRILTRLAGWRSAGGLQLSHATLGAFSKYPFPSSQSTSEKKKFGFMQDDSTAADRIFESLGLLKQAGKFCRHPLAFIVEAADDLCYLTTDIEDAFRVRLLPFTTAEGLLKEIAEGGDHIPRYKHLHAADPQDRIAYLRAGAVSALIDAAITVFCNNEAALLRGTFNKPLLLESKYRDGIEAIRRACEETIYRENKKLQIEAAGFSMIMALMDLFGGMIDQFISKGGADKLDMRNDGLYQLLPADCRDRLNPTDPYRSFLILVDYISGMTDRFVLDTYQRLTGSSVSLGRMT